MYTGYIDIEARHLFFYFFESRRDPVNDDVMLWLNGGPGASSTLGLLMELGPCTIDGPDGTKFNEYGWNAHVNMIFVDQPIGIGWSYADYGETVVRFINLLTFCAYVCDTSFERLLRQRRLLTLLLSWQSSWMPWVISKAAQYILQASHLG